MTIVARNQKDIHQGPGKDRAVIWHVWCRLVWIQEIIVSAAVIGAGFGSAIGGWLSDKLGRKKALLLGDVLFTLGALSMAAARSPNALITG